MKDQIEKERKFLLKNLPSLKAAKVYHIVQYYVDNVRYRRQQNIHDAKDLVLEAQVKIKQGYGINIEKGIRTITEEEFSIALIKSERGIEKYRYIYENDTHKFEVDRFHSVHLIIMEVEVKDIDEIIEVPREIMDQYLMEVTGNSSFDNYSLAIKR